MLFLPVNMKPVFKARFNLHSHYISFEHEAFSSTGSGFHHSSLLFFPSVLPLFFGLQLSVVMIWGFFPFLFA